MERTGMTPTGAQSAQLGAATSRSESRRGSKREFAIARILDAADARLREGGVHELSVRGIAADVELSPAALYRYFAGRDAILTALIARAYHSLATDLQGSHLDVAISADTPAAQVVDAVCAPCEAYRYWALANRHQFELVFGTPIEGYQAPVDGSTSAAMQSVQVGFLGPAYQALESGRLNIPHRYEWDDDGQRQLREAFALATPFMPPPGFASWATHWWASTHGLVALELNGQFRWIYGDDAGTQFTQLKRAQLTPLIS